MRNILSALPLYYGLESAFIIGDIVDASTTTNITVKSFAPQNAAGPIDSAFMGFAFEERSFYYYFGTPNNSNSFSKNLINLIADKTKTQPIIRVGGTSLDRSKFDPHQNKPIQVPLSEGSKGIPDNLTLGPSYFDTFSTLENARFIVDIPLATNNITNSKEFAKTAYDRVGSSNIFAFEIGNEVNLYGGGYRKDWSITKYITQWSSWSAEILAALGLSSDSKIYQAVVLSSEESKWFLPGDPSSPWKIQNIFEQGLNKIENRMTSVSMHYYQTKANPNSSLQDDIMNHDAIVRGSAFVNDAVKYLKKQRPPIPLALAEVGNALGNTSNNNLLENVLGDALWLADFSLYSMSINVTRINYQSGLTFPFSLWNPAYNTTPAGVHATFYGQVFAAEFIGSASNVRVVNLDLQDKCFTAYAAYDNGKLARIAINNLQLWSGNNKTSATTRPSRKVTLTIADDAKSVEVKKLTSPFGGTASSAQNITWGGMEWSARSDGKGVQVLNDTVTLPVHGGTVDVEVAASEAVMAFVWY